MVIADDGSTDGSTEELETEDGWLRVVRGSSMNAYAARNRAARLARGRVLAFCDADCRPERDWLQAGLVAVRESGLAGGRVRLSLPERPTVWSLLTLDMCFDHEAMIARGLGLGGNLFVTRTLFERLGGFDESLPSGGDGDLVARALGEGARPVFVPDAIVWHPTHDAARAFLRRIWFDSRWQSVRLGLAGIRPYGLRVRWWIPFVSKARDRRRTGRPLVLDRRRVRAAGIEPAGRDHLKAIAVIYLVIPYVAAAAHVWGWWCGRGSTRRARAANGRIGA